VGEGPGDLASLAKRCASFNLTMLATTPCRDAYTLSELSAMCRETGFDGVTGHPVPTGPHTVVVGRAA
jgi:hypothetical protein